MVSRLLFFLAIEALTTSRRVVQAQSCAVADPLPSITDIACTTAEFSTACTLLEAAGLQATLNAGGPFTIFLPNDDGFAKLGQDLLDLLTNEANADVLEKVLLNHVVDSEVVVLSAFLECNAQVPMLSGETTTTICVNSTGAIFQVGQGNLALNQNDNLLPKIVEPDNLSCNGAVHQISNVILPQSVADLISDSNRDDKDDKSEDQDSSEPDCTPNIVDVACDNDDFSILCTALKATDLEDVLNQPGPFTVFAPTDDAFLALGQQTLDALLQEKMGLASLKNILLYHVVPNERILAEELVCLGKLQMANGESTRTLCHSRSGRTFQIGAGNSYKNYPQIIAPDVTDACNGIIHVIDSIIFPKPSSHASSGQLKKSGKSEKGSNKRGKSEKASKKEKRNKKFKRIKS